MTYRELLAQLQQLNQEQLDSDVCIWDSYENDEIYQEGVELVFATEDCQSLDINQLVIRF